MTLARMPEPDRAILDLSDAIIKDLETLVGVDGVISDEEGRRAMKWFESDGAVRDAQGRAFRVRPFVCSRLTEYLERRDPALFRDLQARARALQRGRRTKTRAALASRPARRPRRRSS